MRKICNWIFRLMGWSIQMDIDLPDKCVICAAPHTTNWDLPIGLLAYTSIGGKASFLIKKSWFFFPMNLLFNTLGGIPVDRSKKTSLTEQIAEIFNSKEKFQLAITPEGTRKANAEWKMGFYYIALTAHVPIVVASFDYSKKLITFHNTITPSGDIAKDLPIIKSYYKSSMAKYPDKFVS